MRNRRYGRNNRYRTNNDDDSKLLFAEFLFYNKDKNIVSQTEINSIKDKLTKEQPRAFWTDKKFKDSGVFFEFIRHTIADDKFELFVKIHESEQIKNTTVKLIKNAKYVIDNRLFFTFMLSEEQRNFLRDFSFSGVDLKQIHNWEEMVNFLIENKLLNNYSKEEERDTFLDDCKIMFGDNFEITEHKYNTTQSTYYVTQAVNHIVKVIEKRINDINYRVAIMVVPSSYDTKNHYMRVFKEDGPEYIYIDEGRLLFNKNNKWFFVDDSCKETEGNTILIDNNLFNSLRSNIHNVLGDNECVITPSIFRFYKERIVPFEYSNHNYLDERAIKICEQYRKLIESGKTIKVNGVLISKNKIEIDGERFKLEFEEEFLDIANKFPDIKKLLDDVNIRYNFNTLYEKLLTLSKIDVIKLENSHNCGYRGFTSATYKVNDMDITIAKDNSRMKINDIFSRISDVYYILTKVICYNDVNEFNKYVKNVSFIGIEWKKMISNGIMIQLSNPFRSIFAKTGDESFGEMNMRFSLRWDAERRKDVYLLLNGKEYLIKYKGKFKRFFYYPRRTITMRTLKSELGECIEDLSDDMIIEIIENAIKEAKIITARGQELVTNTIADIKAIESEIVVRGGNKYNGYLFKGNKSQAEYFVDKINLKVFKKVSGVWNQRCVVDDHTKQRIFEDRLANRLVNIYNEPQYIFTLHNI